MTNEQLKQKMRDMLNERSTGKLIVLVRITDEQIDEIRSLARVARENNQQFDFTELQSLNMIRFMSLDILEERVPAWFDIYLSERYPLHQLTKENN